VRGMLVVLVACAAFGQSSGQLPEFEAASVKIASNERPTPGLPRPMNLPMSLEGGPGTDEPGQIICTACELLPLIGMAYEVAVSQVSVKGVPYFERFDIVAKVPRGSTRHDFHLMLRQLLIERFGLTLHREERIGTVYALVLGKRAPSLKRLGEEVPGAIPYPMMNGNRLYTLTARQKSMGQLAETMSQFTDLPVIDRTGLKGGYNFTLYWLVGVRMADGRWIPVLAHPKKKDWPPGMKKLALRIEDAARQQLGLRLVTKRAPTDLLVVDSISRVPVLD
jgi:uncharacterized protein (TIGR03435 family)